MATFEPVDDEGVQDLPWAEPHGRPQPEPDGARSGGGRLGWGTVGLLVALSILSGGIAGGVAGRLTEREAAPAAVVMQATPTVVATVQPASQPDIPAIVASVRQSVVSIEVTTTISLGPRTITETGAGTGFVFRTDGMIATNAHVISEANTITVILPDGSRKPATLVGMDRSRDLAVVHIEATGMTPLTPGKSSELRVGEPVVSIGNALALAGGPTASLGIVSALDRSITTSELSYTHLIQTDAAINKGDSGGPLIDGKGRLVGINTVGSTSSENIGFAIAIDEATPVLQRLLTNQS